MPKPSGRFDLKTHGQDSLQTMIRPNYLLSQRTSSCRRVRACVWSCVCTCPLLTAHVPPPPAHYVSKGRPVTSTSSNPALMRVDSLVGLSLSCSLTLLLPRINPVQIILSKHHPTPTHYPSRQLGTPPFHQLGLNGWAYLCEALHNSWGN